MSFEDLHLIAPLLRAVENEGYQEPTPIQKQAIPVLLEKRDLIGCAQTGTGKTAAFALPILQLLYDQRVAPGRRATRALILTPTRELALQIGESFTAYGKNTGLRHTVIFGGVSQNQQTMALKAGVDILIATPGRLLDLMNQKFINLQQIQIFVLDEADRMLDMGFIHDVKRVLTHLPAKRQTMLFSATMPPEIVTLAQSMLIDPVRISVTPESPTVDAIEQAVYLVDKQDKQALLIHLLEGQTIRSALVFTRTKHGADKLARKLIHAGIRAEAIHGNKSQNARQQALHDFKTRRTRVLVATDIAARGIDVEELSHVINFDLPDEAESYVHRIGRTGRNGASGTAITLYDPSAESAKLKAVERVTRIRFPVQDSPIDLATLPVRTVSSQRAPSADNSNAGAGSNSKPGGGNRSGKKPHRGQQQSGKKRNDDGAIWTNDGSGAENRATVRKRPPRRKRFGSKAA